MTDSSAQQSDSGNWKAHSHSYYYLVLFLAMKLALWVDLGKVLTWLIFSFSETMIKNTWSSFVELLSTMLNVERTCLHGKH